MRMLDAVEVGLEVLAEVEALAALQKVGDKAPVPPVVIHVSGRKIRLAGAEAEVIS